MPRLRVGVLVSGTGTNLQAIINAAQAEQYPAEVTVVISNVPTAPALERAARHGIPSQVVDHRQFRLTRICRRLTERGSAENYDRVRFEQALCDALDAYQVELVCLAGFMRVLTPFFVQRYSGRIMNIHPALLPAFKGLWGHHVHEAVLASGARYSGCTVHFVTEEVDGGPIILQRVVPVYDDDTPETLAARVQEQEHQLYPEAIRLFAEGRLRIVGNRVIISQ